MKTLVLYRGEAIIAYGFTGQLLWVVTEGRVRGEHELETLEPGDYVLLTYDTGQVGGGYIGIDRVECRTLHLGQSVARPKSDELWKLQADEAPLSPRQQGHFISLVKGSSRPWDWENASATVRALFTAKEDTPADEARILVREAFCEWDGSSVQDKASALIERALGFDSGVREARILLGKMALARGDVNAAIAYFLEELAKATKPDALNAHSYLAAIYRELGRESDAQRHALAGTDTPEYRQNPTQLGPTAVDMIKQAVSRHRRTSGRTLSD